MGVDVLLSRFLLSWPRARSSQAAPAVAMSAPEGRVLRTREGRELALGVGREPCIKKLKRLQIFRRLP